MSKTPFLILVFVFALNLTNCRTASDDNLYEQLWEGNFTVPDQKIRVILAFSKPTFGNPECRITIPEQGLVDVEASQCRISNDSLHLKFSGHLTANYDAKLTKSEISGKWSQGGHLFNLDLERTEETKFQAYVETALDFAKRNSLNSDSVDWAKLSGKAMEMSKNASEVGQLMPAFQLILRELSDKHGAVIFNDKRIAFETENFESASTAFKKAAYGNNVEVVSAQVSESIGYLRIPKSPDFKLEEDEKFNREIQKHICDLIAKRTTHWIIDLRLNEGGSMFPMLGGLNQLFKNGKIGSFVNSDRQETNPWLIKDGNIFLGQDQRTTSGFRCRRRLKTGKIAVLIGPATASSGEAVVVALRGLANSRIFGEPTRGFTTAVVGINIGDDVFFTVSTSYYADVEGRVYNQPISPDFRVEQGDNFKDIVKGRKVLAAIKWIQG